MLCRITEKVNEKLFIVGELSPEFLAGDLNAQLGEPHYVETDALRTYGGEEWYWGFMDECQRKIVIDYRPSYHTALIICSKPEFSGQLLGELGIKVEDFQQHEPFIEYH